MHPFYELNIGVRNLSNIDSRLLISFNKVFDICHTWGRLFTAKLLNRANIVPTKYQNYASCMQKKVELT
jgi:hypothetical protein